MLYLRRSRKSWHRHTPGFYILCLTRWTVWACSLQSVIDNYAVFQELWDEALDIVHDCDTHFKLVEKKQAWKRFTTSLVWSWDSACCGTQIISARRYKVQCWLHWKSSRLLSSHARHCFVFMMRSPLICFGNVSYCSRRAMTSMRPNCNAKGRHLPDFKLVLVVIVLIHQKICTVQCTLTVLTTSWTVSVYILISQAMLFSCGWKTYYWTLQRISLMTVISLLLAWRLNCSSSPPPWLRHSMCLFPPSGTTSSHCLWWAVAIFLKLARCRSWSW